MAASEAEPVSLSTAEQMAGNLCPVRSQNWDLAANDPILMMLALAP